jgi:hypothetical protein
VSEDGRAILEVSDRLIPGCRLLDRLELFRLAKAAKRSKTAALFFIDRKNSGAALMTETRMESQVVSAVSNLLANTPLEKAMYETSRGNAMRIWRRHNYREKPGRERVDRGKTECDRSGGIRPLPL